jgi:peptidyl-tRNA hydrolase
MSLSGFFVDRVTDAHPTFWISPTRPTPGRRRLPLRFDSLPRRTVAQRFAAVYFPDSMAAPFKLIVGLGNPGPQYLLTRHNIGFLVLDAWADEDAFRFNDVRTRFGQIAQEPEGARLLKPLTFMNESGRAVATWLDWLKLSPSDLLVIVDDVALPLGQIRVRPAGSAGGHNGLKDAVGGMIGAARRAIQCCQSEGIAVAMNRFNGTASADPTTEASEG